jgi:hypothetical protein
MGDKIMIRLESRKISPAVSRDRVVRIGIRLAFDGNRAAKQLCRAWINDPLYTQNLTFEAVTNLDCNEEDAINRLKELLESAN